jgi:hypothetical protein
MFNTSWHCKRLGGIGVSTVLDKVKEEAMHTVLNTMANKTEEFRQSGRGERYSC